MPNRTCRSNYIVANNNYHSTCFRGKIPEACQRTALQRGNIVIRVVVMAAQGNGVNDSLVSVAPRATPNVVVLPLDLPPLLGQVVQEKLDAEMLALPVALRWACILE